MENLDPAFLEAHQHRPHHRVLFRKLAPYSAAHVLALHNAGSPLVSGESVRLSVKELVLAVKICANTNPRKMDVRASLLDHLLIWMLNRLPRAFADLHKFAFADYFKDYDALPDFWDSVPDRQDDVEEEIPERQGLSGPYLLARVISYALRFSVHPDEAWLVPIGELVWADEQASELLGVGRRFFNPADEEDIESKIRAAEEAITPEMIKAAQARAAQMRKENNHG